MAKSKKPLAAPTVIPEKPWICTASWPRMARISAPRARDQYETRRFIERYGGEGLRLGVVRIPVVVHILWNTPGQNFTDAQVQAQIDVLNADFRAANADAVDVPPHFAPVAADTRIESRSPCAIPICDSPPESSARQVGQTSFTMAATRRG